METGGGGFGEAVTMLTTEVGTRGADYEARDTFVSDVDEAWETCRDAVESARRWYAETVGAGRHNFEQQQRSASSSRRRSMDAAWAVYKQEVASAPTVPHARHDAVTAARAAYNASAAKIHAAYSSAVSEGREAYGRIVRDARSRYEAAAEAAFAEHRRALEEVSPAVESGSDTVVSPEVAEAFVAGLPDLDLADLNSFSAPEDGAPPAEPGSAQMPPAAPAEPAEATPEVAPVAESVELVPVSAPAGSEPANADEQPAREHGKWFRKS
jgi:hypothetical protein